jgi:hypothetical protein
VFADCAIIVETANAIQTKPGTRPIEPPEERFRSIDSIDLLQADERLGHRRYRKTKTEETGRRV